MSCFRILSDYIKKIGDLEVDIEVQISNINGIFPMWIIEKNDEMKKLCNLYDSLCRMYKNCIGDCFDKCDKEVIEMMNERSNKIEHLQSQNKFLEEKCNFWHRECNEFKNLYESTLHGSGAQIASLKQMHEDREKDYITKIKTCNVIIDKYKKKIEELQSQVMSQSIDLDIERASAQLAEHEFDTQKIEYDKIIENFKVGLQQRDKDIQEYNDDMNELQSKLELSEKTSSILSTQMDDCMLGYDKLLDDFKYQRLGIGAHIGSLLRMIEERDANISEFDDKNNKTKQVINKLAEKTQQQRLEIEELKMTILKAKVEKMRESMIKDDE
jgi:hypothetical protein